MAKRRRWQAPSYHRIALERCAGERKEACASPRKPPQPAVAAQKWRAAALLAGPRQHLDAPQSRPGKSEAAHSVSIAEANQSISLTNQIAVAMKTSPRSQAISNNIGSPVLSGLAARRRRAALRPRPLNGGRIGVGNSRSSPTKCRQAHQRRRRIMATKSAASTTPSL